MVMLGDNINDNKRIESAIESSEKEQNIIELNSGTGGEQEDDGGVAKENGHRAVNEGGGEARGIRCSTDDI